MKLIFAVLHLRKNKMEVVSEDRTGRRRKVDVSWLSKEKTNSPPVFWPESVEGELDYQDSVEFEKARGRFLP